MISSIAIPTSLASRTFGQKATPAQTALNAAGSVASTIGYFDTLYSAIGRGPANTPFAAIGVAGAAFGAYGSIQGLRSQVTGAEMNDALKGENNGHDLNADDANRLAGDITQRLHRSSTVSLISHVAFGAAIVTGNMPLALGAIALGVGSLSYAGYNAVQDAREVIQVLAKNRQP